MLLKFEQIDEIGRFSSFKHKAPQFPKLPLVFARNGYGKSTLCSILRSASESKGHHISARRRLGAVNPSSVRLSWAAGKSFTFAGVAWNSCPGMIHVFDQEFVHQNLHIGESVTRDNKRSLLPIILGQDGVALAQKIIDLDKEQRELGEKIRGASQIIRARLPVIPENKVESFCRNAVPADIAEKVEDYGRKLELAKNAHVVRQKANLRVISAGTLSHHLNVLSRTLDSVSADATARIRAQLELHKLGARGEAWLKFGADHADGESCPFCNQPTADLDLIGVYKGYFSEAFSQLSTDRDEGLAELNAGFGVEGATFLALLDGNGVDVEFWKTVCQLPVIPDMSADQRMACVDAFKTLDGLYQLKVANPLAVVRPGAAAQILEDAFALMDAYNVDIAACAAAVDAAKAATAAIDVAEANRINESWKALQAKQAEPVKSAVHDYIAADNRRKELDTEKKAAQTALTAYSKTTIATRQTQINELLALFGAGFSIVDVKATYVGREPNTDYALAVGSHKVKVGDRSNDEPSFKTVLSAGDKSTLALALFLCQVRADPNIADAVVVFDDPFNSQDMGRQFETTSQIRAVAKLACQTIVFSHDARFLHMIERDAPSADVQAYQISCTDQGVGDIKVWSSEAELKTTYIRHYEMITEYAKHGTLLAGTDHAGVHKAIRPFLEDFIKNRFPGRFAADAYLHEMATAIEASGATDPMHASTADLLALNEYTRPTMHGGALVTEPIALRAQCQRVQRIIGLY
ncbi:AAA family ATPase [Phreatobacter sp.]|uniref:AAA family ATPase n=1 Tax=Phreatobacter sp. TaxID=1966341 RepID=UPI0025FFBC8B|nr:AAA family ATPase [Phreatobacter sp.]